MKQLYFKWDWDYYEVLKYGRDVTEDDQYHYTFDVEWDEDNFPERDEITLSRHTVHKILDSGVSDGANGFERKERSDVEQLRSSPED